MTAVNGVQTASSWFNPGFYLPSLPQIQAESPQAPDSPVLDTVELSLKALYAGRAASHQALGDLEERFDMKLNQLHATGLKANAASAAARKTALMAGGISIVHNMASMAQGDINMARATGNVTADIASGAIGGIAAGAAGAMGIHGFLNSGKFMAGTMGTVMGAVGFVAADYLLKTSGLKDAISDGVTSVLEKDNVQSLLPVML